MLLCFIIFFVLSYLYLKWIYKKEVLSSQSNYLTDCTAALVFAGVCVSVIYILICTSYYFYLLRFRIHIAFELESCFFLFPLALHFYYSFCTIAFSFSRAFNFVGSWSHFCCYYYCCSCCYFCFRLWLLYTYYIYTYVCMHACMYVCVYTHLTLITFLF